MSKKLFNKILVSNRGEIAVRVINACRLLGIPTLAIYSTADKNAVHVKSADEAVEIGPPAPRESYLNISKIIETALQNNCDAIHPGYGFLAENPDFPDKCKEAGVVFIGPSGESMRLMGNKVQARIKMAGAGVPLIPGMKAAGATLDEFEKAADDAGYPVLIKAAAGGGGKGMRVVKDKKDLKDSVEAAKREAKNAFDDDTVYLEKYIEDPRHIEFQVLADSFGNVIHLYERECSIQRRHQKIIEETPSIAVTPDIRKKMGEAAVKVTQAADYVNAGTIEFLLDKNGGFYFLEMNTRVQVEHPVTEMVTGVDLVAEQIKIAAGEKISESAIKAVQTGHSIECRIYAEDAENGFLPSSGKILFYNEPAGPGIRVDTGVTGGVTVGVEYDPILAKLIVHAPDRDLAISKMINALKDYKILGIRTSRKFMMDVLEHAEFKAGRTYTDFIDRNMGDREVDTELVELAAAVSSAAMMSKSAISSGSWDQKQASLPSVWEMIGNWEIGMRISK
ncbi:MAG: acetyl-CoA carboxylase biotin carboxylase subunit [candidate division Zixibacteria bacterium]|nr:acetyl-CoA carboxylase biotin carboxylase subunit [candidate division Zixibacteria bacterium]